MHQKAQTPVERLECEHPAKYDEGKNQMRRCASLSERTTIECRKNEDPESTTNAQPVMVANVHSQETFDVVSDEVKKVLFFHRHRDGFHDKVTEVTV
jgi:hypothetical protein